MLSALNQLFKNTTLFIGELEFIDKPLLIDEVTDEVRKTFFTVNESRKYYGLPPVEGYDVLLSQLSSPPAFSLITGQDDKKKVESVIDSESEPEPESAIEKGKKLSDEDYEMIKDLGRNKEDFEVIPDHQFSLHFDKKADIAKYIIDHDMSQLTIPQIVEILEKDGISTTQVELSKILQELRKDGVIKIQHNDTISIKPPVEGQIPDTAEIQVMYDYVKKPSVSGAEIIETSRGFCRKLCGSNRYYTREDIQTMSSTFGYDIFRFTGGWYTDSTTGEASPSCRHMWQRVAVK
ncbi:MAG: hypothetical protein EOO02_22390, partial [Chitinophagaceae bacterium]